MNRSRDEKKKQTRNGFEKLRLKGSAVTTAAAAGALALSHPGPANAATTFASGIDVTVGGVFYSSIALNTTVDTPLTFLPGAASTSAYGLVDASLTAASRGDAFDDFGGITVNGVSFNQPGDVVDFTTTTEGAFFTTITPADIGGIDTSLDYFLDGSSPTMRVFATLTNNNTSTETTEVAYGGDLGSDDFTTIEDTSSGDAVFDQATDRWMITSDRGDPDSDPDPLLTFVRFGPGGQGPASTPAVPSIPSSVTGGDAGIYGEVWELELAPGETQSLMMFVQLSDSLATAQAGTSDFDSLAAIQNAGLSAGLTSTQVSQTVNWVPEPGSGGLLFGSALIGVAFWHRIRRWFQVPC